MDIDVSDHLYECSDHSLIHELEERGYRVLKVPSLSQSDGTLEQAYLAVRGRDDIPEVVRRLIFDAAGRVA